MKSVILLVMLLSTVCAMIVSDSVYITYIGWEGKEGLILEYCDKAGNQYVCGSTDYNSLPVTSNALQKYHAGRRDAYIIRVNPQNEIDYLSYFGGSGDDGLQVIVVDSMLYLFGTTDSRDLPVTEGSYQTSYGGGQRDGYIAKINIQTNKIYFCTYIGGSGYDFIWPRPVVDDSGAIYIAGYTTSGAFPKTSSAAQRLYGGGESDAFVAKLSKDGKQLIYSTLLGGNGNDEALGLTVDSLGQVYVCGVTGSTNFPVRNGAYQSSLSTNYGNCFVTKISADGMQFINSTYIGGQYQSRADALLLDGANGLYVVGRAGFGFPTTGNAFQKTASSPVWDGIVAKVSSDLSTLIYSTYLGGSRTTELDAISRDRNGNIYVSGGTYAPDFPVPSYSKYHPSENRTCDMVFAILDSTLTGLLYGGVIGGSEWDYTSGMVLKENGDLLLGGLAKSTDFPTTSGALQETYGGGETDGVLIKIPREEIILGTTPPPSTPKDIALGQSYPNPVHSGSKVTIPYTVTARGTGTVAIYNSMGQQVYSRKVAHHMAGQYALTAMLPGLPKGLYFYTLEYGGAHLTSKLVVE